MVDQADVKSVVGEIAAMEYAGDVKAVAIALIDKDGDVRILYAYPVGTKLPLIAATAMLHRDVLAESVPFQKDRD